jgi:predicted nucleotidyltransferase component of viral defense system
VRYATAAAFRQALDDRLKTEAARTGLPLARLRKQIAFELFLRRLVAVAPDRWVLKGALALELRLKTTTRATRDIDLGRGDDEQAAIEDLTAAQQLALDDFFTYAATRTDALADTDEFTALRFHVTAQLAGRTFEQFTLDIGFTNSIADTTDTITTSDLLAFAGIDPFELPALPLPRHLAEKLHAYTRTYGSTGRPSTRPKDLVDILLIAHSEPIDARALRTALEATFAERGRRPLPARLTPPPTAWTEPYHRLAAEVDIEPNLDAGFARAAAFLDPILAGHSGGTWEPRRQTWA